jgi:tetratricopeptide (TPR) repeat protein
LIGGVGLSDTSDRETKLWERVEKTPESPMAFYELARYLIGQREIEKAQSILRKGLDHHPNHRRLRELHAKILAAIGDMKQALDQLAAADEDGSFFAEFADGAEGLIEIALAREEEIGTIEVEGDANDPEVWLERCEKLVVVNDNRSKAEVAAAKGLSLVGIDSTLKSRLWNAFGWVLDRQDRIQDALQAYSMSYSLDPIHSEGVSRIAHLFFQSSWREEAEAVLRIAIGKGNINPKTYYRMGMLHRVMERWHDAAKMLRVALSYDPDDSDTLYYCADSHYEAGEYREAREIISQLTDPKHEFWKNAADNILAKIDEQTRDDRSSLIIVEDRMFQLNDVLRALGYMNDWVRRNIPDLEGTYVRMSPGPRLTERLHYTIQGVVLQVWCREPEQALHLMEMELHRNRFWYHDIEYDVRLVTHYWQTLVELEIRPGIPSRYVRPSYDRMVSQIDEVLLRLPPVGEIEALMKKNGQRSRASYMRYLVTARYMEAMVRFAIDLINLGHQCNSSDEFPEEEVEMAGRCIRALEPLDIGPELIDLWERRNEWRELSLDRTGVGIRRYGELCDRLVELMRINLGSVAIREEARYKPSYWGDGLDEVRRKRRIREK